MAFVIVAGPAAAKAESPAPVEIAAIDLSKPFNTRSPWRFTASQDAPTDDPIRSSDGKVPGVIHVCLQAGATGPCDGSLRSTQAPVSGDDLFAEPHYLDNAAVVHPRGTSGRPLLLVTTASSLPSMNGNQRVLTQILAYQRGPDRFMRVYDHVTGRNNNEEVRFVETGLLQGHIISVEPTGDAPFGFWVSVNALTPAYTYREVLRYRSATRYGDGNPLAVIDSEMPNIGRRLGFWRPGLPLPLPRGPCPAPHIVRMELWCAPKS